ncbi:MAG: hypothetical protein GY716_23630 [bacterium]|nr:hypothetical protein [bacterium]
MHDERDTRGERGSALVIALMVTVLLFVLGAALLATSDTETLIAANDQWSEGAFQAADAAVQVAVDQLDVDNTTAVVSETTIGDVFVFKSGGRDDSSPQPPELMGTAPAAGYTVAQSTGYNNEGYSFAVYRISGTGTGPRNTEREVEVEVVIGPIQ